jgi:flagellar motor switch protein FliN/FliY
MAEPGDTDVDENAGDAWADALAEQGAPEGDDDATIEGLETPDFDELEDDSEEHQNVDLEMILDIPVTISMEIGRTSISIRNLLKLNQGSVVELDRLAGEPLDVLVNGTLIAHGEVVVVNEKFGIRLTDVITQMERIRKLA